MGEMKLEDFCTPQEWETLEDSISKDDKGWVKAIERKKTPKEKLDRIEQRLNFIEQDLLVIKKDLQELIGKRGEMTIEQSIMSFIIAGKRYRLDTVFEKENDMFVAFIPDLDMASQGDTIIDAYTNLKELTEFYFEGEDEDWIKEKLKYIKSHR